MTNFQVHPIGTICTDGEGSYLKIDPDYIPALHALDGFSHINAIWWFSGFDTAEARAVLETEQPYKNAPAVMGIFATRSPIRPNPLLAPHKFSLGMGLCPEAPGFREACPPAIPVSIKGPGVAPYCPPGD